MKTAIQFFRSVLKYPKKIEKEWGVLFLTEFIDLEKIIEDLNEGK